MPNPWALALLADRDWHRARVQVTDDDIRRVGLGDPDICEKCPRLVAWIDAQSGLRVVNSANDGWVDGEGGLEHGIWLFNILVAQSSPMAHDHIINAIAAVVSRPPLDVLDEIAAMELPA